MRRVTRKEFRQVRAGALRRARSYGRSPRVLSCGEIDPPRRNTDCMTATFQSFGIRFLYPENWELAEETSGQHPRSVQVQSPTGAVWSLYVYETPAAPRELADEALAALTAEYPGLESRAAGGQLGNTDTTGYDVDFYCLDLVIACRIRSFRRQEKTFLVICQAETREFDKLSAVFEAISLSLVSGGELSQ